MSLRIIDEILISRNMNADNTESEVFPYVYVEEEREDLFRVYIMHKKY